MAVVIESDSERRLSSRTFLVLDPTPSKKNINDDSNIGGTLVEGPTTGLTDDGIAMTSTLVIAGGDRVAAVAPDKLLG